jgi:hypothetical protein
MILKSFGCSFIFGSELSDDGRDGLYATPSQLTWPAHLAQGLDYKYQCYARPGAGNLQILEQILNQAASNNNDLFVVGWTWIDRFDYYPADPTILSRSPWRTIMPIDTDALAKTYYRDLHSEYRDKFTCLSYIKLAIDTLNQKKIPFIMTYMDGLLFDQQWHATPAVIDLQKYVKSHMTTFENQSFLEWSRAHGYPETTAWHPLEEAHAVAGKYMINVFDTQKTNGLTQWALF